MSNIGGSLFATLKRSSYECIIKRFYQHEHDFRGNDKKSVLDKCYFGVYQPPLIISQIHAQIFIKNWMDSLCFTFVLLFW